MLPPLSLGMAPDDENLKDFNKRNPFGAEMRIGSALCGAKANPLLQFVPKGVQPRKLPAGMKAWLTFRLLAYLRGEEERFVRLLCEYHADGRKRTATTTKARIELENAYTLDPASGLHDELYAIMGARAALQRGLRVAPAQSA
jgi:hypothetical protein